MALSRRRLLGGFAGWAAAGPVLSQTVLDVSPVPRPRPISGGQVDIIAASEALIARAGMTGKVAFAIADAESGSPLGALDGDRAGPPASTAKALTAAYALDHLGPAHRFSTRLLATGPVRRGRLEGDLVLAGGGDPMATTDTLAQLLDELERNGVRSIAGRFLVFAGALPQVSEIDPDQPDHLGYNPAVSGLNLNYNRVHFGWARQGAGYRLTMDARTDALVPPVHMVTMRAVDRALPIYTFAEDPQTGQEAWTVSRPALGGAGSRWLPVRKPADYAAEVFQTLAAGRGLLLSAPEMVAVLPAGVPVAEVPGPILSDVAKGMLRYSTNLTAEVLGLAATVARTGVQPAGLAASAAEMNSWAGAGLGMEAPGLRDHSGLSDLSRVTPQDMVRALNRLGPDGPLWPLLREIGLKTETGQAEPFTLRAKTGTLNFVSCLTGYVRRRGAPLAFSVMTADLARRAAIAPGDEEKPAGATGWARRSRALQYDLVRLWARYA